MFNSKNRTKIAVLTSIILSPILYISFFLISLMFISHYQNIDFSKDLWINSTEDRYKLSNDLIQSGVLIGMSKQEVIDLLGADFHPAGINKIEYYLGYKPQFVGIDPDVLVVYFLDGKVFKVIQRTT